MPIEIHTTRPEELPAVCEVHRQAFDGPNEARLVELLHARGKAPVSLVATLDGQVVGHVLFSPIQFDPPRPDVEAVGLAPLGVLPAHQRQGVGSRLTRKGLQVCRAAGYALVVVLGHPSYYPRFGFMRASDHGLANEYGAGDAFMVIELKPGVLTGWSGTAKYQPEFKEVDC